MNEIPQWGRVTAEPHEFLIQIRRGRVVQSGHGASCFKWPGDSVALVPTSIRKLSFRADQVTLERAGVEVTGLAVYRIVEPLLAYRMIDRDPMALTEILREMFVGATRRIVAGLSLEECLTHRKERVAAALMREIAPVLAGEGTAADATAAGWGVVIDTIEIQDVKVLSQEVFSRLQAPYREELAMKALVAHEQVALEEARQKAERAFAEERGRLALMAEQEHRILAEERGKLALMAEQERRVLAERRREIEATEHREELARRAQEAQLTRLREASEAERDRTAIELATRREAGELEAELGRLSRSAPDLSEARLAEVMLVETLPKVADAFRGSFDKINVTSTDGGNLFAFLSSGLEQVMDVARARGVTLPRTPAKEG